MTTETWNSTSLCATKWLRSSWSRSFSMTSRLREIDPEAPLFGDGLGLDSIDALELAFAIAQKYGFKLRSDDERNREIFSSSMR